MAENIIRVTFEALRKTAVIPKTKLDYGQKLEFVNLDLPETFEADFCNAGDAETKTVLGQGGIVQIPDEYLQTGKDILCYLYLHYTPDSGQTQYTVKIPVTTRPDRTEETPTPEEQSLIEQALAALNDGVERAEAAAELLENPAAEAETLAPGSDATADYVDGTFLFGIPQGEKGDPFTYEDFTEEQKQELVDGPILDAQTAAVAAVNAAGTTQVGNVNAAGTTQVGNVNTAGTTQVAAVNQAGATQIQAVEDKGDEVIESIPQDYSELTAEVDELKNAFDTFSGVDGVSAQSINGSANIDTAITETITQNNYWYATGGGTIASGGAKAGMDKAVFDITNMSGKIAIGFDPNANYGSGSMVVGLSSSAVAPYTRVAYYSVSNIQSNPNYFTVNGAVVTADLDAIKSAYPTAVLMFVNVPHDVWKLDNITTFKKTLHWLSIAGYVPSIVVAADGSGDYTTIAEAVAEAKDEDTIYIKDGIYTETVVVNKYLHLVGQSKQGTILQQNVGDYNNCPLCITQGSVCNMTIKSLAPADTSGLTDYAYAIHLDTNFASLAKYQKCEIWNCDIFSEVNDAIGAGTNYATEYDIHDCSLHVAHNPVKAGACGFKCHNGQNQTTGKVTLRNNVIITEDANGTSCYDILYHNGGVSNTQPIEILQVGNVLKYYHNGISNIFVPSDYNYGNSVPAMNTLS